MGKDETNASASRAAGTTETQTVSDLLGDDRKDEATAHLTLPALPQERGVTSKGEVTDDTRVKTAQDERDAALGDGSLAPVPAPAKAAESDESRTVEVRVNEQAGTQEAVTIVSEPPAQSRDGITGSGVTRSTEPRHTDARTSIERDAGSESHPLL